MNPVCDRIVFAFLDDPVRGLVSSEREIHRFDEPPIGQHVTPSLSESTVIVVDIGIFHLP